MSRHGAWRFLTAHQVKWASLGFFSLEREKSENKWRQKRKCAWEFEEFTANLMGTPIFYCETACVWPVGFCSRRTHHSLGGNWKCSIVVTNYLIRKCIFYTNLLTFGPSVRGIFAITFTRFRPPPPTVHLLFYLLFVRNCPGAKYLGAIFSKEPKNSSSLRRFNVIPHTSFVACLFKLRYHYSAFWGDVSWKNHRDPSFFGWGRVYIWACQKKFRPYSLPRLFELLYLLYFSCTKVQMHKLQMHTAAAISFKYSDLRSTVCLPLQPLLFTWTPMEYWPVRV